MIVGNLGEWKSRVLARGARVAQSIGLPTPGFGSDHDLQVLGLSPCVGLRAEQGVCFSFSSSPSAPQPQPHAFALSLSIYKTNVKKKKKRESPSYICIHDPWAHNWELLGLEAIRTLESSKQRRCCFWTLDTLSCHWLPFKVIWSLKTLKIYKLEKFSIFQIMHK